MKTWKIKCAACGKMFISENPPHEVNSPLLCGICNGVRYKEIMCQDVRQAVAELGKKKVLTIVESED